MDVPRADILPGAVVDMAPDVSGQLVVGRKLVRVDARSGLSRRRCASGKNLSDGEISPADKELLDSYRGDASDRDETEANPILSLRGFGQGHLDGRGSRSLCEATSGRVAVSSHQPLTLAQRKEIDKRLDRLLETGSDGISAWDALAEIRKSRVSPILQAKAPHDVEERNR